jgi:hypothetical protein
MKYNILCRYLIACIMVATSSEVYSQCYVEDIYFDANQENPESVNEFDLIIRLSDTFNLDRIELKIGDTPGDSSVFQCTYPLHDAAIGCQQEFSRNGVQVKLDMDNLSVTGISFYQVLLYDFQNNQLSSYIKQL